MKNEHQASIDEIYKKQIENDEVNPPQDKLKEEIILKKYKAEYEPDEEFKKVAQKIVVDVFDKLGVKMKTDDPVFSVIIANQVFLNYYMEHLESSFMSMITSVINKSSEASVKLNKESNDNINIINMKLETNIANLSYTLGERFNQFNTLIDEKLKNSEIELNKIKTTKTEETIKEVNKIHNKNKSFFSISKHSLIFATFIFILAFVGISYTAYKIKGEFNNTNILFNQLIDRIKQADTEFKNNKISKYILTTGDK